jgi:hypothetical protein
LKSSHIESALRGRLSQAKRNWEAVEGLLADALSRVSLLETETEALGRSLASGREDWEGQRKELERAVREKSERLEALESEIRGLRGRSRGSVERFEVSNSSATASASPARQRRKSASPREPSPMRDGMD